MLNIYNKIILFIHDLLEYISPYVRRIFRLFALPYCFVYLINWNECKKQKKKVIIDLLYIFFKLKYFPDNYSLCRLWEKSRLDWHFYYGSTYDPYQRYKLRKEVQNDDYTIIFKDKEICHNLCKANDIPIPKSFGCFNPDDDIEAFISNIFKYNIELERIILKPILGQGGKNIAIIYKDRNHFFGTLNLNNKTLNEVPIRQIKFKDRMIVQEVIKQHRELNFISSKSINTIRIVTLLTKVNKVLFVGALIRFGVGDSFVDNTSSGGIGVGINIENGILNKFAYDMKSKVYSKHPTSQVSFKDYKIPFWNDVLKLSNKIQHAFPNYRLLGHDIAITPTGPCLIEINESYDNVGLEQKFGPILKNREVHGAFKDYRLFVNRFQHSLYDK